MNFIKKYTIFAVAATIFAGCTDKFEDFNKNPYGPTSEDLAGDNVETGILIQAMTPAIVQGQQNDSQMIDQMVGLEFGRHAAMINPWNGTNFYTYNPQMDWYGIPFDKTIPQIYSNFFQIKEKTGAKGIIYAWAQVLRVAASLKVSDCYGPIPYSKVNGVDFAVGYDSMEELFNNMFKDLDEAISTIESAISSNTDFSTLADFDYVYKGNFTKWLKYANSLKLRMAIRIVNANPTLAQTKAEEAVNNTVGVMTEAGDAAYCIYNDGMNPFYRAGYTWGNNKGEFRASADITSYMNGYNDPRMSVYFEECAAGGYNGVRNGIQQNASSFAGYQNSCSQVKVGQNDPLLIMSAAEVYFLRAEGKLRGWDMGEGKSAKDLYEDGVKTSMSEKGASIGDYLNCESQPANYVDPYKGSNSISAQTTIVPKYDESAGFEKNLERIIVQKWIATYPSGWETWADFRRTGYPKFFPVVNNLSGSASSGAVKDNEGMRRLPFSQSEYNTNNTNVLKAVQLLGGSDNAATNLWWAKKSN